MDCWFPPTPTKKTVLYDHFPFEFLLELIDNLAIKFQEVEDIAPSLLEVVGSEQMLLEECADLLHQALNTQVRFHQKQNEYLLDRHKLSSIQSFVCGNMLRLFTWCYAVLTVLDIPNCVGDGRQPEGTTFTPEKSSQKKNMKAINR